MIKTLSIGIIIGAFGYGYYIYIHPLIKNELNKNQNKKKEKEKNSLIEMMKNIDSKNEIKEENFLSKMEINYLFSLIKKESKRHIEKYQNQYRKC